ncbi:ABC transporter ATP-binding protein [Microbacterium sp. NPDC087592]|uniref:ABC transporter ATP-binding protein n=1 Tax=Microbacterium sp. NPDC087592 TaxID=3364193 RepID=UPI0037F8DAF7
MNMELHTPLLQVDDLHVEFGDPRDSLEVIRGVSLRVEAGRTMGIVGESGSGKSVTVMSLLGLLPKAGRVTAGTAHFMGQDLLELSERRMQSVRGGEIGMIFQDPMTALNPIMSIGQQIDESLRRHSPDLNRRSRHKRILELLDMVRIPRPDQRVNQHPHELSGGMRQRVMIAIAMANNPRLILADEPTTALDVTVQAQILRLLLEVQRESDAALVLITHDLGVIAEVADHATVMYAGTVVETGTVRDVFHRPSHPYTVGLLQSRLTLTTGERQELPTIPGQPPDLRLLPTGCAYRPRCHIAGSREICRTDRPPLNEVGPAHAAACFFSDELAPLQGANV